jgi:outer membrane protein TolC
MMNKKSVIGVILLLLIPLSVPCDTFEIPDLISALKKSSPAWEANRTSFGVAHSRYRASRSSLYPSLSLSVPLSYRDYESDGGLVSTNGDSFSGSAELVLSQLLPTAGIFTLSGGNELAMERTSESVPPPASTGPLWSSTTSIAANLTQPLYFGDAYGAAKRLIEKSRDGELSAALSGGNELIMAAVGDFYELKQSTYSLDLIKTRLEREEENYRRVEAEYGMGLWTKSVLYQAKSLLLKARTDLLEAEQQLETKLDRFMAMYGLTEMPELGSDVKMLASPSGRLFEELLDRVLTGNLELAGMRSRVEIKRSEIIALEKEHAPVLSAGGGWNMTMGLGDNETSASSYSVTLSVSAPLLDGGSYANSRKRMDYELQGLEASLQDARTGLTNRLKSTINLLKRGEELAELYELQKEAAEYEYERGLVDYEMGRITKKELSELELALEQVLLSIQQNRISTNMNLLQLHALQGIDLSESSLLSGE